MCCVWRTLQLLSHSAVPAVAYLPCQLLQTPQRGLHVSSTLYLQMLIGQFSKTPPGSFVHHQFITDYPPRAFFSASQVDFIICYSFVGLKCVKRSKLLQNSEYKDELYCWNFSACGLYPGHQVGYAFFPLFQLSRHHGCRWRCARTPHYAFLWLCLIYKYHHFSRLCTDVTHIPQRW